MSYMQTNAIGTINLFEAVRRSHFDPKILVSCTPEEFGEGSFDKGVYFKFPLNLFSNSNSNSFHKFTYRPVTRDGAAKLQISENLYELTLNSQAVDHVISRNY